LLEYYKRPEVESTAKVIQEFLLTVLIIVDSVISEPSPPQNPPIAAPKPLDAPPKKRLKNKKVSPANSSPKLDSYPVKPPQLISSCSNPNLNKANEVDSWGASLIS
jgi:hypothetical protein